MPILTSSLGRCSSAPTASSTRTSSSTSSWPESEDAGEEAMVITRPGRRLGRGKAGGDRAPAERRPPAHEARAGGARDRRGGATAREIAERLGFGSERSRRISPGSMGSSAWGTGWPPFGWPLARAWYRSAPPSRQSQRTPPSVGRPTNGRTLRPLRPIGNTVHLGVPQGHAPGYHPVPSGARRVRTLKYVDNPSGIRDSLGAWGLLT